MKSTLTTLKITMLLASFSYQKFETRLENEPRVGTLIRRSLLQSSYKAHFFGQTHMIRFTAFIIFGSCSCFDNTIRSCYQVWFGHIKNPYSYTQNIRQRIFFQFFHLVSNCLWVWKPILPATKLKNHSDSHTSFQL